MRLPGAQRSKCLARGNQINSSAHELVNTPSFVHLLEVLEVRPYDGFLGQPRPLEVEKQMQVRAHVSV